MPHPGGLPGWCQDFKPSLLCTLQSARQRLCLEEIPPSDSWFNRHFSVPKGANIWFVRALFLKSVSYFHHEEEELVKFCTILIQHLRRVLNGDSQDPFRMWNKSFVVFWNSFLPGLRWHAQRCCWIPFLNSASASWAQGCSPRRKKW